MLAVYGMAWGLLLVQIVTGVQEVYHTTLQGAHIESDGQVSIQAHMHNDAEVLTISPQGAVMRRERELMSAKSADDETYDNSLAAQPVAVKRATQGSGELHHMHISNATAQLAQLLPGLEGGLKCNSVIFAPSDPCPFECPFLAEDAQFICHFRCLTASACGSLDPLAKIADSEDMICRACKVDGCADCIPGPKDTCRTCEHGYSLDSDGKCYSPIVWVLFGVKITCLVIVIVIVVIAIELLTRKKTNWKGFRHGAAFRWRTRIHMPPGAEGAEDGIDDTDNATEAMHSLLLYPLSTNLLRQPIAGAGFCLHMNFCIAVLIWAAVIIYVYSFAACMVSIDMLVLGLSPAKTAQQLCEVVHWGHDAQMRLIWAKTGFIAFAYVFTFFGCIAFGIYQKREFHRLDDECTMGDFAAFITGLPELQGSARAEDELARFVEQNTGQPVLGASIAWNYTEYKEEVDKATEADWKEREEELNPAVPEDPENPTPRQPKLGFVRRQFRKLDCFLGFEMPPLNPDDGPSAADALLLQQASQDPGLTDAEMTAVLNGMVSSDCAFIIFDTEEARNAAIVVFETKAAAGQPVEYKGSIITMTEKSCEPRSVRFCGLAYGSTSAYRVKKMVSGCIITLVSLSVWAIVFYFPYAYYMCSFSYAHGQEPDRFAESLFTLLVVAGNQGMYFLADFISHRAMFSFEDDREIAYNYVYVTAVVLNSVLDIGILLWLSYKIMIGIGAHTADDRLLANLNDFRDIFESYPIQKIFGELLYEYSFPACFCIPFILEGVCTIFLPHLISKNILLSHDEVQGRDAERTMVYFLPMNLGRYGDIILNMILCTLVFFCPGGFTLPLFIAFFFCHVCIYIYDSYRVLRCTPAFCYASTEVDYFGQLQLIIPTSVLGGCLFFRLCQMYPSDVLDGALLYFVGFLAFAAHCVTHWALVRFVIPKYEPEPHQPSTKTYAEIAEGHAITFFSANPVHCLRSKYIFKDQPPNIMCIAGKEHLQKRNEKVGAYFEESKWGGSYMVAKSVEAEENQAKLDNQDEKTAEELDDDADPDF